ETQIIIKRDEDITQENLTLKSLNTPQLWIFTKAEDAKKLYENYVPTINNIVSIFKSILGIGELLNLDEINKLFEKYGISFQNISKEQIQLLIEIMENNLSQIKQITETYYINKIKPLIPDTIGTMTDDTFLIALEDVNYIYESAFSVYKNFLSKLFWAIS